MSSPKVTDYERKRLENIRRNKEMMAALKLQSKASQLSNHTQVLVTKSNKKPKIETPILLRRSTRTIGGVSSDSGKKKEVRDKVEFKTKSEVEIVDDGFKWRKYGQKMVKNSPNPRNYYKCTVDGCQMKKRVEKDVDDSSYVITYDGTHTHPSFH